MVITDSTKFRHKSALSASKIDSYQHCSQKFGSRYLFNLPDTGNSGSSRGTVCHSILELLVSDKHRKLVKDILKAGTCKTFPALWRLIRKHAKNNNVDNTADLDLIDGFLITGLDNGFYGPKGTETILVEKEFDFEVYEPDMGIDYRVRGLIDKIFFVRGTGEIYLECVDYKSSKAKFAAAKIESNVQASMYQLAAHYLFPEMDLKRFHFLFIKFPQKPAQEFSLLSEGQLRGFEYFLTDMQKQVDGFTEANLLDNLGILKPEVFRLCGKEGFKDSGEPHFLCPARKPLHYFCVEEDGKMVASGFTEKELKSRSKAKPTDKIVKRFYSGCGYFFDEKGKPRNLRNQE